MAGSRRPPSPRPPAPDESPTPPDEASEQPPVVNPGPADNSGPADAASSDPLAPTGHSEASGMPGDRSTRSSDDVSPTIHIQRSAPLNVVQALACVQAEIGGVPRMTQEQRKRAGMHVEPGEGVSWAYRGIDQIAQAAQPLMGKYGVVIVPNVVSHLAEPVVKGNATKENTKWYRQSVTVDWSIYGPGGVDDVLSARTIGVGDDNSDKGMNKAMTTAYKNLLLRLLCIGDPQDDTDNASANNHDDAPPPERFITDEQAQSIVDAVLALPEPHKAAIKLEIADRFGSTKQIRDHQWADAQALVASFQARAAQDQAGDADDRAALAAAKNETATDDPEAAERRAALAAAKLAEAGLESPEEKAAREAADAEDREWVDQATAAAERPHPDEAADLFEGEGYG